MYIFVYNVAMVPWITLDNQQSETLHQSDVQIHHINIIYLLFSI